MSLSSIVLTSFVGAYYLGRVSHDSGLVEALSERISNKGVWRCVVTADAPMDVL
jgi:multisubunit Na+/H+ antiporter MnhG subunit